MNEPLLIVSEPRKAWMPDFRTIKLYAELGVSGIYLVIAPQSELDSILNLVSLNRNINGAKLFVVESNPSLSLEQYFSCPDYVIGIAERFVVCYADLLEVYKNILKRYPQARIIPTLNSVDHVEAFLEHHKGLNYPFVDIGPVGNCSRNDICGQPMGLEEMTEIIAALPQGTRYVVSGGIRLENDKAEGQYGIEEVYGGFPKGSIPAGIIVGSPISARNISELPFVIPSHWGELRVAHSRFYCA